MEDPRAGVLRTKFLFEFAMISPRFVFPRPERRKDSVFGFEGISAADAAGLLILVERLGFEFDLTNLCNRLRAHIENLPYLTDQEISILFYEQNRHRLSPVTLMAPPRGWRKKSVVRFRTRLGYLLNYVSDEHGRALWLKISAPKYRKIPDPQSTTCSNCGFSYMRGERLEEKEHRRRHRLHMAIIHPTKSAQFDKARKLDAGVVWVHAHSPAWKHLEMYRRALAFKRELGYDFPQWAQKPADNTGAVGYLFADEDSRIIGACAFRLQQEARRPWRMDWIWLCPAARRKGYLERHWPQFRQRFGEFDVEHPLSPGMQGFLRKHGEEALIRG